MSGRLVKSAFLKSPPKAKWHEESEKIPIGPEIPDFRYETCIIYDRGETAMNEQQITERQDAMYLASQERANELDVLRLQNSDMRRQLIEDRKTIEEFTLARATSTSCEDAAMVLLRQQNAELTQQLATANAVLSSSNTGLVLLAQFAGAVSSFLEATRLLEQVHRDNQDWHISQARIFTRACRSE